MNNYCRNCGKILNVGETSCINCNTEVIEKRIDVSKIELAKKNEKKFLLIFASLIIMLFLSNYISVLEGIRRPIIVMLAITIITACIKIPSSKFFKAMLFCLIFAIIAYFLLVIFIFYTCFKACGVF